MYTIILWWGIIGWCVAMVSIGFLIDCHMRSKVGTPSASYNKCSHEMPEWKDVKESVERQFSFSIHKQGVKVVVDGARSAYDIIARHFGHA